MMQFNFKAVTENKQIQPSDKQHKYPLIYISLWNVQNKNLKFHPENKKKLNSKTCIHLHIY